MTVRYDVDKVRYNPEKKRIEAWWFDDEGELWCVGYVLACSSDESARCWYWFFIDSGGPTWEAMVKAESEARRKEMDIIDIHPMDLHALLSDNSKDAVLDIQVRADGLFEIPRGGQVYRQTIHTPITSEAGLAMAAKLGWDK